MLWRIHGLQTMYFQEGKSFILLKLSTQALSKHLSKAEKEKLNCSVVFQPISQLQYWAEKMAIGLWFFFLSVSTVHVSNGSTDSHTCVSLSTFPSARPFIHPCAASSVFIWEMAERTKKKNRKGAGCLEQSRALSLRHKSLLWSLEHNKASPTCTLGPGSKIIPIMQHVCDCRNPPWPYLSSLWRIVPETWCQAAANATLSMPNPWHTHCSYSLIQLGFMDGVGCPGAWIWHRCQLVL